MIMRLALAATVAAGLALSTSGADAAPPPVLDGKRTKTLTFKAVGAPQDQSANQVTSIVGILTGDEYNPVDCSMPACAYLDFKYLPARGVKAKALAFQSTWASPAADIDLYVASIDKYGDPTDIAHCGAGVGTREQIHLAANNFKPGRIYRIVAVFYRTVNESVTTKVTFNGANTVPTTAPSEVDGAVYPINCGL